MRKPLLSLLFVFLCLLLTQCDWLSQKNNPTPADDLPPATQEGKNTFGCRVNGEIWLPSGFNGTPNVKAYYDPYYEDGSLNISSYRSKDRQIYQSIGFYSDSLTGPGVYSLYLPGKRSAIFQDVETTCIYHWEATYQTGTLTITKFDTQSRIVAGTFEFTLAQPGCDTIRVTDGRFDLKL